MVSICFLSVFQSLQEFKQEGLSDFVVCCQSSCLEFLLMLIVDMDLSTSWTSFYYQLYIWMHGSNLGFYFDCLCIRMVWIKC